MRTARLVGPTPDGTSVVLVTEDGEELDVALDPHDPAVRSMLRQAQDGPEPPATGDPAPAPLVRRPPPRRETPMDTPLSPRDIQTRIRAGESLADVVAGSGTDVERIERFAAPVLAEREHLALTALGSSVRRRGEASGHRPLRSVVADRLQGQGVDADDVAWDAWKVGDSSWQLSADYALQGEPRHAEFRFDAQGRFSVAEDDDARWLAGEAPSPVAASIDRDDELALVRATREPSGHEDAPEEDGPEEDPAKEDGHAADTSELIRSITEELAAAGSESGGSDAEADDAVRPRGRASDDEPTLVGLRDEAAEPTVAVVRHLTRLTVEVDRVEVDSLEVGTVAGAVQTGVDDVDPGNGPADDDARSALDTLYDMLGGHAEESARAYAGLSDAAAVPEVDAHDFEPPTAVLVPAEPDPEPLDPEPLDPEPSDKRADEPMPTPVEDDAPEPLIPSPGASRKPGRRTRASVPSWDEIMFGGPKPS